MDTLPEVRPSSGDFGVTAPGAACGPGVPVQRPRLQEATALGAAHLAGLAAGVWPSTEDIVEHWQLDLAVEPLAHRATVDAAYTDWQRAVERSRNWTSS